MIRKRFQRLPAVIFLLLLLASPIHTWAQQGVEKLLRKANSSFNTYDLVNAEELYNAVMDADPNNYEAAYKLGLVNSYLQDYPDALRWYRRAVEIDPARNDTVHLRVGLAYKRLGNYRKAKESFQEFITRHGVKDEYTRRAELEIQGCDLAEASAGQEPPYRIGNASFNSSAGDLFPAYLDQRQEDKFLVFTSHRPKKARKKKLETGLGEPEFSDLYLVVRENDTTFGEPENFGKIINTKLNDGTATFTGDGLTMYFTICNDKRNKYGCSIYESRYNPIKKAWGTPIPIEGVAGQREVVVNSRGKTKKAPTDDRQPFITKDGRTLFFVSDRGAGIGGFDIWFSRRVGVAWSAPINAGNVINTAFDEISPFVNKEGNKLYFASDGLGGFGGYDLYVAEGNIGEWRDPVNLGAPLNSSYDDFGGYWMDGDSLTYFTSNRPGGMGSNDIYWAKLLYYAPPPFEVTVQGLIRDKDTKQPIPFATAILYEYTPTGSIIAKDTFNTDQSAHYDFPLEKDKDYKVLGNAPEYFANEVEVSTKEIDGYKATLERNIDIELEPIIIGKPIVLQNIYYDYDEHFLRPDALVELNNLIRVLNQNPNITIILGSHTDTNGTLKYNDDLSERRAMAAVKYLAQNGIQPARLQFIGYGETQPLVLPELSDEDEQKNRRTEFRITSIEFE